MDLDNFIGTSTYAIEAVYNDLWSLIPKRYRIKEDDYQVKDMAPFYDPELSFDNRLHYKLTNVDYPKRATPWFVITWNTEIGLLRSELTQRVFQTAIVDLDDGRYKFRFLNVGMNIYFGVASNTMTGLFELQENLYIKKRNKTFAYTREHPIIGSFPVCIDVLDSQQNKLSRDKGTLCYLMIQSKIDYPIIADLQRINGGRIETINYEIDSPIDDPRNILVKGQITGSST